MSKSLPILTALTVLAALALPILGFAAAIGSAPTLPPGFAATTTTGTGTGTSSSSTSGTSTTSGTGSGGSSTPGTSGSSGGVLAIQFSSTGLSSVQWNGTEMLASGVPSLSWVGLIQPDGSWVTGDSSPTTTVDTASHTVIQQYAWGSITYVYTIADGTQLFANITVKNTSTTPMGEFIMQLLEMKFPQKPAEFDGSDPMLAWNMGNPCVLPTTFGTGKMVLTNENVSDPLMVGWPWSLNSAKSEFPLLVLTGGDNMLPSSYPFVDRQVPAGGSYEFKLGFRFGAATASTNSLASDFYQNFATVYPYTLNWTDHRPVAQVMLTNPNGTYPTNPRLWFGDGSVDTTTPAGIAAFQQRLLALAQQTVSICKAENAQGVITWDIEGQQFAQPTTFIGDPRLIDTLDPEMSSVVDAYFKTFTDAGLRVGMTIRPQQLVLSNNNTSATQTDVADPGALMLAKMQYAYSRWGATIFYVDSNGAPDDPIDPKFFKEVTDVLPNVLIIPEHANLQYYSITAPYGQLNMGMTGTPASVSQVYPKAFSVFTISDGDVTDNLSTLVQSVTRGDCLFFRGWFNANENAQVTQIYGSAH